MNGIANEADLAGEPERIAIFRGVVGWDGEGGDCSDLGTDENGGATLVRVQLFDGRLPGTPTGPGKAAGRQIKCQVMGPFWAVPPAGQVVLIAFPDGHVDAPGAGIILGWIGKSPNVQFKAGRSVVDLGEQDLIVRAKSVTLSDQGTPACWLTVGPSPVDGQRGIVAMTHEGAGVVVHDGNASMLGTSGGATKAILQLGAGVASIQHTDHGGIAFASTVQLQCVGDFWAFYPRAFLGIGPASLTPSGSGPPGSLNFGKAMLAQAPSFSVGSPAASSNTFIAVQ